MDSIDATPHAASLIEGLRDFGYTLEAALADIIDNSITAGATHIRIVADYGDGNPVLAVVDDGTGMTRTVLEEAMRPGSLSPLLARAKDDLGRFGLGMKTASFSQCRKFTVATRLDGVTSTARWDLDYVVAENAWRVLIPNPAEIAWLDHLGERGTLVLWEHCDRISKSEGAGGGSAHFNRLLAESVAHLQLVFHRYLKGEPGLKRVRISLNGAPLEPIDPFFTSHPATVQGSTEVIACAGETVEVTPFTLPHHSKVTQADWDRQALEEGYLGAQGFYLYRQRRLIVHGTWFGLARQLDLSKLARVRIDIPNGLDAEWKINVLKASAQPPAIVRARLKGILDSLIAGSRRAYTHRGRRLQPIAADLVWDRVATHGDITYELNATHAVFEPVRSLLDSEGQVELDRALRLIARTLPVESLLVDFSEAPTHYRPVPVSEEELRILLETHMDALEVEGFGARDVARILSQMEAFASDWDRAEETMQKIRVERNATDG